MGNDQSFATYKLDYNNMRFIVGQHIRNRMSFTHDYLSPTNSLFPPSMYENYFISRKIPYRRDSIFYRFSWHALIKYKMYLLWILIDNHRYFVIFADFKRKYLNKLYIRHASFTRIFLPRFESFSWKTKMVFYSLFYRVSIIWDARLSFKCQSRFIRNIY